MSITLSEIDFASDVKDFVTMSSDVSFSDNKTKEFIMKSLNTDLLKVTKTINSPVKIIKVEKIDEEFVEKNL